jgi:hypothetical protein
MLLRSLSRALAAATLAVALATTAPAHAADPLSSLNLHLSDLPHGFVLQQAVTRNLVQTAHYRHQPIAQLQRLGYIQENAEDFASPIPLGLIEVESQIEQFRSLAYAHQRLVTMGATLPAVTSHPLHPLPAGRLGDEAVAFTATVNTSGVAVVYDVLGVRVGAYTLLLVGAGLAHNYSLHDLTKLAAIPINRVAQHG